MLRAFLFVTIFALSGLQAQPVQSGGAPASVLSPTSPGVGHGAPASVTSRSTPGQAVFNGSHRVVFGTVHPHNRRRAHAIVPVPIFIPAYPLTGDSAYGQPDQAPADQTDQQAQAADVGDSPSDSDALRQAYYQGAHDALAAAQQGSDSRYGEHYLDSREKSPSPPSTGKAQTDDSDAQQNQPDDSPATVFVFKDGHKIETQNYAIQGQTLYDFSNNHLTKVKLAEIDLDATKKANDELGITVRLPSGP